MSGKPTPIERFMAKVEKTDTCWIWKGSKNFKNYGRFWDGNRDIPAHWFLLPNYPPEGHIGCHKCDNPPCVNPNHIFIGTQSDNIRDSVSKGRRKYEVYSNKNFAKGERCNLSKLKNSEVSVIKAIRANADSVSKKFGVTSKTIINIWRGVCWGHVSALPENHPEVLKFYKSLKHHQEEQEGK